MKAKSGDGNCTLGMLMQKYFRVDENGNMGSRVTPYNIGTTTATD